MAGAPQGRGVGGQGARLGGHLPPPSGGGPVQSSLVLAHKVEKMDTHLD